jgi:hypothetical protein
MLCNRRDSGKPLVHHAPKRPHRLGLAVKEIFEEAWLVQGCGIGIPLTVFAELANPVRRLMRVDYLEKIRGIKVRPAGVVENPKYG